MTTPPSPTVAPAEGRLGVLTVGLGAVASTLIAGVELVKRGMSAARRLTDSDGHDPSRKAHRQPQSNDPRLRAAGVARRHRLRRVGPVPGRCLHRRHPGRGAGERQAHRGGQRRAARSAADAGGVRPRVRQAHRRRQHDAHDQQALDAQRDPRRHQPLSRREAGRTGRDALGASTEIFIEPGPAHATLEAFEAAIDANDPTIAPSMLYAYAAILEGVPFANGAPEPDRRHPGAARTGRRAQDPDQRQGLQDRPDA